MDKEKGAVDGLKDKLYSRTEAPNMDDVRAPLTREEADAPKAWQNRSELPARQPRPFISTPESRLGFATKFLIVSAGFFFVALAVAGIAFFWGPNTISPKNITITVLAPSLIDGGKEAQFQIVIDNNNPADLKLADLVIDYPSGTRDPKNPAQTLLHERQSVGTIAAASQIKRTSSAILYGQEGSSQTIRATLQYSVEGSNAVFTQFGEVAVTVGSSPVSVSVNSPSEAIAGQTFPMEIVVRSNSTAPINNVVVQGQLPFGYRIESSDPKNQAGTLWRLGTLGPGESRTIKISGAIDGQDGDARVFKFLVGQNPDATSPNVAVPFLTMPTTITVSRPFVAGTIAIGGQTGKVVSAAAGSSVGGTVSWQNNLSTPIQNAEIRLKLTGPMINRASIDPGIGFYDSQSNSIIWTAQQDPSLSSVQPGGSGQYSFSFSTYQPGEGGVLYTNPTATLALSVSAVRPGQGNVPQQVTSAASTQVNFSSQIALSVSGTYVSGARPPMAEAATVYSITWSLKNSFNTIGNAAVTTVLPPYATFTSGPSGVVFDPQSRTITWTLGDVKPGVGYTSGALSTSFQISITPSASQVGSPVPLTGAAALSGTDRFTGTKVQASAAAPQTLDTVLPKQ